MAVMMSRDFSQLPVINKKRKIVGLISLAQIQDELVKGGESVLDEPVTSVMQAFKKSKAYTVITPSTPLVELDEFFESNHAGFVTDEEARFPLAVVTKVDVVRFLSARGG